MKGRYLSSFVIVVIALLLPALPAYSQNVAELIKATAKNKPKKQVSQDSPKLNSAGNYIVRPGDSLHKIGRAFGTTPEALMSANKLRNNKIKPGQEFIIPGAHNTAGETAAKAATVSPIPRDEANYPGMSRLMETDQILGENGQPRRLQLVKAGFEMLGVRYRHSGMSEKSGFDCSGLVKSLFLKFNIELPRSSRDQFRHGEKVEREELEIGDLVFFSSGGKSPTHVGIYIGNDKFIHAARKARQVIVSDLNKIWYTMQYLGARRIMDLWRDEQEAAKNLQN